MHHILLIEDNPDVRENTAEILELFGYTVSTAADGKQGVEKAQKHKPDLIICDIMMPVLDGYGVLHMLSNHEETANIPFIFLTAMTERSEVRKGMEMGADDYITKPFDKTELLKAVESRLKKAASVKKEYQKNMEGLGEFIHDVSGSEALKQFTEGRITRTYRKKENIYREGDYPRGIYYLNSGKVKICKLHDYGKELITSLLKEGDFFGYISLLEDGHYTDSAEVIEDAETTFIPREEFFKFVYSNRDIARKFLQMLTRSVSEQQDQLVELAYSSVRRRVAEALLLLQKKYKKNEDSAFSTAISREDLANIVGTATESLIRTLSDFKSEKLIEIREGKIFLINEQKLSGFRH